MRDQSGWTGESTLCCSLGGGNASISQCMIEVTYFDQNTLNRAMIFIMLFKIKNTTFLKTGFSVLHLAGGSCFVVLLMCKASSAK